MKREVSSARRPIAATVLVVLGVLAVLGKEGIVQGKDYRGVKVLSVLKAIPDSPWFMVAKVDLAEALAAGRSSAFLILALILAILLLVAVCTAVIWQRNQKAHYRSLFQAEEKFRVLFEVSQDAIMTLEPPTWRFTSGNPATVKMFKVRDEAEFVSKGPWELSPEFQPDGTRSDDKAKAIITKAMQEGSSFFEWDHMRMDGEVFPATVLLTRVTLGEKVFLQATTRDVTEAKKAREELQASEEKFKALFENVSNGIFLYDLEAQKLLSCNKACLQMLGYTQEEFTNLTIQDLHPTEDIPFINVQIIEFAEGKKGLHEDIRFKRKDGSILSADLNPTSVTLGGRRYILVAITDVTERKQAEQRQAQLVEQLEHANRELADFAYIVSHDLKAPVRGIATLADWVMSDCSDKLDEEDKKNLQTIQERARKMTDLIDGVLRYSRACSGEEKLTDVDLKAIVDEAVNALVPPPSVDVAIETPLPTIQGDKTKIGQVFQNLVGNAIKYMDKPQGQIRIGCRESADHWQVYVSDNGPGIEDAYHAIIFKMFKTAPNHKGQDSTGVGLAIVEKIVKGIGGRIWVESVPGEGSTFIFTVPKEGSRQPCHLTEDTLALCRPG